MQSSKQIGHRCKPSATTRSATANLTLRLTPEAWGKLSLRRELNDHRVCGFGISAAADPLVIEDIRFLHRRDVTDALDDAEVLEFFAREIQRELPFDRYARIWVGTRPGRSARPSPTDEAMFARLFGAVPWSVLFLVANGGATYAGLRYRVGPGGSWRIPAVVDEPRSPTADDHAPRDWEEEGSVEVEPDVLVDDARLWPEEWPVTM